MLLLPDDPVSNSYFTLLHTRPPAGEPVMFNWTRVQNQSVDGTGKHDAIVLVLLLLSPLMCEMSSSSAAAAASRLTAALCLRGSIKRWEPVWDWTLPLQVFLRAA